jgi:hypothetical protein
MIKHTKRIGAVTLIIAVLLSLSIWVAPTQNTLAATEYQMMFPLPTSTNYTAYSSRSWTYSSGGLHPAWDITCSTGTAVYAATEGTVTSGSQTDSASGLFVQITSTNEYGSLGKVRTNYNHLSQIVVSSGTVSKGQLIGYSGATGVGVTGPHLHFQILKYPYTKPVYDSNKGIYTSVGDAIDPNPSSTNATSPKLASYGVSYIYQSSTSTSSANITTNSASGITDTNAILNGYVIGNVKSSGFYWGTSRSAVVNLTSDSKLFGVATNYAHTVTCNINTEASTTLVPGTLYYFMAVTIDVDSVTHFGEVESFKTTGTPTLSSVSIYSLPSKTTYFAGETLNTSGLALTATYSDGTSPTVPSGFTCSPTSLTTVGIIPITVTYGGKSTSFNVTVNEVTPPPAQQVASVTANPDSGAVSAGTMVALSTETSGATIRYTTNGSEPTASSTQYTAPIAINAATTIKAKAFKSDMTDSEIATFAYTVTTPPIGDGIAFIVGNVIGVVGKTVEVPITVTNNTGITAATLSVTYDRAKLQLTAATSPNADLPLDGFLATTSGAQPLLLFNGETDYSGNGTVVTLTFNVLDDAELGNTAIGLSFANGGEPVNANFASLPNPQTISGSVTIINVVYGDVDNNGVVNMADLVQLKQFFSRGTPLASSANADVDGNGVVNMADLVRLKQFFSRGTPLGPQQ